MLGNNALSATVGWAPPTAVSPSQRCAVGNAHSTANNPAVLSPLLAEIFPAQVVCAEFRGTADPSLLFPSELASLGRVRPQRLREFTAGRLAARRALAEFGLTGHPLDMKSDRRPHWPEVLTGSISHTAEWCGVVVASHNRFRALGLDLEIIGQVTPEIWPLICTPQEAAWLRRLGTREQMRGAALIFSAKEAFYKCQYQVTQQWLEFGDVTLDIAFTGVHAGYFTVRPCTEIMLLEAAAPPWHGRFRLHGGLVITGMTLQTPFRK